jgi:hypothetical protein
MPEQIFSISWNGGQLTETLLGSLIRDYLSRLGYLGNLHVQEIRHLNLKKDGGLLIKKSGE